MRMAAMWKDHLPAVHVSGIISHDGQVARDPTTKNATVREHWGPIFEKRQANAEEVKAFASKFIKPWSLKSLPPPASGATRKLLKDLKTVAMVPMVLATVLGTLEVALRLCMASAPR